MNRLSYSLMLVAIVFTASAAEPPNYRKPTTEGELRYWLENMIWHHRFSDDEIVDASGLTKDEIAKSRSKFNINDQSKPKRKDTDPLLVLPYPGGRHPRIGFLDGAVRPQRETKISVFAPWDDGGYVVVDVPEAIWSNLGLTYLAHTHVPTVWTKQKVELPPLEWQRRQDGSLVCERKLPNGIVFGTRIRPRRDAVHMEMWLTNGTKEVLSDLRVQVCAMLKGMSGFSKQTNDNKVFQTPYAACKSDDGKRWVVMAWEPIHRTWGNEKCPCLHSDPKFPDCAPGETQRLHGVMTFHEGEDIQPVLRKLDRSDWRGGLATLHGSIVDADTGKSVAARVYMQSAGGAWLHVAVPDAKGLAVNYSKQRADTRSVEIHTSISAHPFRADVPPGRYTITIERGKEYLPLTQVVDVPKGGADLQFKLKRWIDLAHLGWYCGDTHVHRTLAELPTVMQAEDLNVAFPLIHWVHDAFTPPGKNPVRREADPGRLIPLDDTHVIYPRNTEYEIFSVGKRRHTLGAFFVLNHKTEFEEGVPPVVPIAKRAHQEGALIELDKHNWPWSMALVPVMPVDLYELTNNHVWRTEFGFREFGEREADYMKVERDAKGWTERGWLDFGFKNYYALLNCGFRLRPTAGTASGVHPVPLGFGRVYVHLPDGFTYEEWLKGLNAGRSFVTTGPMLFVEVNQQPPGSTIAGDKLQSFRISGKAVSAAPLQRIEVIVNGQVQATIQPQNRRTIAGAYENTIDHAVPNLVSSWTAVRCFESHGDNRVRFAHTAPFYIERKTEPLRPRKEEVQYLIDRVESLLRRDAEVLPQAALDEYREALRIYRKIGETAQ